MFKRFCQIVRALAQLLKQARVLDGNHSLCRKIRDQLDLPLGKWPHQLPKDRNNADQFAVFEHGHTENRSCATEVGEHHRWFSAAKIGRFFSEVGYVNELSCSRDPL